MSNITYTRRTVRLEFEYTFDDGEWQDWCAGLDDWSENDILTLFIDECGMGEVISDGDKLRWSFVDTPKEDGIQIGMGL